MLCSSCSQVVKPIVAIDIDGTLGDYHAHFADFAAGYLGWSKTSDKYRQAFEYDGRLPFSSHWNAMGVSVDEFRRIKLAYRQGGMKRSMPIYLDSARMVHELKEEGAEVWLTTTRPYLRLDGVDPDTRFWLDRHGILYDGLLYDEDKYRVLAENVDPRRVVAVMDDLPEQYDAAFEVFGQGAPILRMTRWNQAHTRFYMARTLEDATRRMIKSIRHWKGSN